MLSWAEAMQGFVDRTGRPGPATWEAGDFPEGRADFPVGGVSWYEAAAFAEFAGKSLPTLEHWWAAAGRPRGSADLIALSNFRGQGPVAADSTDATTAFGAVDMAGNLREWCWNASAQGRSVRGAPGTIRRTCSTASPRHPPSTARRRTAFVASDMSRGRHLPRSSSLPIATMRFVISPKRHQSRTRCSPFFGGYSTTTRATSRPGSRHETRPGRNGYASACPLPRATATSA